MSETHDGVKHSRHLRVHILKQWLSEELRCSKAQGLKWELLTQLEDLLQTSTYSQNQLRIIFSPASESRVPFPPRYSSLFHLPWNEALLENVVSGRENAEICSMLMLVHNYKDKFVPKRAELVLDSISQSQAWTPPAFLQLSVHQHFNGLVLGLQARPLKNFNP